MKKQDKFPCLERETTLGDKVVSYIIRKSRKAKNVRIVVREGTGLEVVIPETYPVNNIEALLHKKAKWIQNKLKQMEENAALTKTVQDEALTVIRYLGKEYPIVLILDNSLPIRVELSEDKALLTLPRNEEDVIRRVIDAWYRWAAKSFLSERTNFWAQKMGVSYQTIYIRNQKTRWGSCSIKNNLSFNMRIIMAPLEVVDYIIIHELAHLKEMNHSKRFWRVVEEFCPDYKKCLAWLKKFGPGLTL
ncbi:MAG: M48 family metallopeptidase [Bacillota bacterium]|nr:M48 family metallopeptidase [Clostridia bacterium]